MAKEHDPRGENPTEAFPNTLGDTPQADGGHPALPHIDTKPFAERIPLIKPSPASSDTTEEAASDEQPLQGSDAEAYEALKRRRAERRKKKLVRRGIAAGVIVALIALGGGIWWFASQQTPEKGSAGPVTETATRGTYTDAVDIKGTLEPNALTVVSVQIDGTVESVNVTEGQHVNKGDTLLTIKNDDLDREVAKAERALKEAKASLKQTQENGAQTGLDVTGTANAVRASRAPRLVAARAPLPTNRALRQVGGDESGIPQITDDTPPAEAQAISAVLDAQETYDLAAARAAQRVVTAPASGSIVSLNAKVGASLTDISAGAASSGSGSGGLMQIANLSKMKVTVQVSEEDIAKVAVDQQATVTFPAFSDVSLTGRVTGIASVASADGSSMSYSFDGGSSPTFAVDILIDAPDGRLKPGMTAEVSLITKQLEDVIMVPTTALLTDDGATYYVNVLKDAETGETERRDVEVVAKNDDFAVIGRPKDAAIDSNPDLAEAPVEDGDTLVTSGGGNAAGSEAMSYMAADGSSGGGMAVM